MEIRAKIQAMHIVVLHNPEDRYAAEVVATALIRSFTVAQVVEASYSEIDRVPEAAVLINPPDERRDLLANLGSERHKALLLGRLGPAMAAALGLHIESEPISEFSAAANATCTSDRAHDESAAAVVYHDHPLACASPIRRRPFCRYDFAEEWNNLGFGRITADGGPWSVAVAARAEGATPLAQWTHGDGERPFVYAALTESASSALLWFNRAVGPVDSLEWRIVETFFGDYRADALACLPYLAEVPAGYTGGVMARLDCDEAIATARPLCELYADAEIPLSLAVLTGMTMDADDLRLIKDVTATGGCAVSHSMRHLPRWGGDYSTALGEAAGSKRWLEEHVAAEPVRYAVSPFHQNPPYAVAALAEAGYDGFVGGIIANDPEYLLGRAGRVPFASRPIVSHSSQCMLHGDCLRRAGQRLDSYCQSFDQHLEARALFGYLDHPFSARYQYGWDDEATRVAAHRRLIERIGRRPDIWWPNLRDALDFLRKRDATRLMVNDDDNLTCEVPTNGHLPPLEVLWKGRAFVR